MGKAAATANPAGIRVGEHREGVLVTLRVPNSAVGLYGGLSAGARMMAVMAAAACCSSEAGEGSVG
jgi:hypothetical protein